MPIAQTTDPIAEAVQRVDLHGLHRLVQAYTYLSFEHAAEANRLTRVGKPQESGRQWRRAARAEARANLAHHEMKKLLGPGLDQLALRLLIHRAVPTIVDPGRVVVMSGGVL